MFCVCFIFNCGNVCCVFYKIICKLGLVNSVFVKVSISKIININSDIESYLVYFNVCLIII